jgi:Kef-type K+ transport system membrane component KefB
VTFVFEYFYYRITQFYFKWDKRNSITAVLAISTFQSMMIVELFLVIIRSNYSRTQIAPYSKMIAFAGAFLLILFAFYNYKKYYNKYSLLKNRWKDETKIQRTINGTFVLLCLIMPWIIVIYLGIKK